MLMSFLPDVLGAPAHARIRALAIKMAPGNTHPLQDQAPESSEAQPGGARGALGVQPIPVLVYSTRYHPHAQRSTPNEAQRSLL